MPTDFEWQLSASIPLGIANWDAISNAIQAQIVVKSGLPSTSVIWNAQGRDRPVGSFISLAVSSLESEAPNTPQQSVDDNPASTGSDGIELIQKSEEPITFAVRVQYFKGTKTGNGSAWARLSTIVRYLSGENATNALDASLVTLAECGVVNDISTALETEYESRAVVDLRFSVIDGIAEGVTYIQTADAEPDLYRADGTLLPPTV